MQLPPQWPVVAVVRDAIWASVQAPSRMARSIVLYLMLLHRQTVFSPRTAGCTVSDSSLIRIEANTGSGPYTPVMRKGRLPIKKAKPAPVAFAAELDAESKEMLRLIAAIAEAHSDTTALIDSLQVAFAKRAAVDEEVVFPHADERLTKREHREALARAQLRTRVLDALMTGATAIDGHAARRVWCALLAAEAAALFADEKKLRLAFHANDLRALQRNAANVRAEVAAAFSHPD